MGEGNDNALHMSSNTKCGGVALPRLQGKYTSNALGDPKCIPEDTVVEYLIID